MPVPTIITSSCGETPNFLPGPNPAPALPSYGKQRHDQHCRGEAIHALLHHDAVDGQPCVVGQEGLSCRTNTGHGGSAPLHEIGMGSVFPTVTACGQPHPHHSDTQYTITKYTLKMWHMVAFGAAPLHFSSTPCITCYPAPPKKVILGCFHAPAPWLLHPSWWEWEHTTVCLVPSLTQGGHKEEE